MTTNRLITAFLFTIVLTLALAVLALAGTQLVSATTQLALVCLAGFVGVLGFMAGLGAMTVGVLLWSRRQRQVESAQLAALYQLVEPLLNRYGHTLRPAPPARRTLRQRRTPSAASLRVFESIVDSSRMFDDK